MDQGPTSGGKIPFFQVALLHFISVKAASLSESSRLKYGRNECFQKDKISTRRLRQIKLGSTSDNLSRRRMKNLQKKRQNTSEKRSTHSRRDKSAPSFVRGKIVSQHLGRKEKEAYCHGNPEGVGGPPASGQIGGGPVIPVEKLSGRVQSELGREYLGSAKLIIDKLICSSLRFFRPRPRMRSNLAGKGREGQRCLEVPFRNADLGCCRSFRSYFRENLPAAVKWVGKISEARLHRSQIKQNIRGGGIKKPDSDFTLPDRATLIQATFQAFQCLVMGA